MKSLLIALCMLFAFTAHSQSAMHIVTYVNPSTGRVENISALVHTVTPPKSNPVSSTFVFPKSEPISVTPLSQFKAQLPNSNYTITPYTQTSQYHSAQDAMKMLDAIISPTKH